MSRTPAVLVAAGREVRIYPSLYHRFGIPDWGIKLQIQLQKVNYVQKKLKRKRDRYESSHQGTRFGVVTVRL